MNKIFLLILRIILFVLTAINVFNETGFFTTLCLAVLYGLFEHDTYTYNKIIKKLDQLNGQIDAYVNTIQKNNDELTQKIKAMKNPDGRAHVKGSSGYDDGDL